MQILFQVKKNNLKRKKLKKGEALNTKKDKPWKNQKSDKACYMCCKVRYFVRNYIHKKNYKEEKGALKPRTNLVTTGLVKLNRVA